jgi:hypothetical protein
MELLLNLLWMVLILPTFLMCWQAHRHTTRRMGRFQVIVLAVCLLSLVFPILSISDDFYTLRAEIDEPAPTKRTLKGFASSKAFPHYVGTGPAQFLLSVACFGPEYSSCGYLPNRIDFPPKQEPTRAIPARAPPISEVPLSVPPAAAPSRSLKMDSTCTSRRNETTGCPRSEASLKTAIGYGPGSIKCRTFRTTRKLQFAGIRDPGRWSWRHRHPAIALGSMEGES